MHFHFSWSKLQPLKGKKGARKGALQIHFKSYRLCFTYEFETKTFVLYAKSPSTLFEVDVVCPQWQQFLILLDPWRIVLSEVSPYLETAGLSSSSFSQE